MNTWDVFSLGQLCLKLSRCPCADLCMDNFNFLRYIPRNKLAVVLYSKYRFNFIKNCQIIFPSGCTILHSQQWCIRDPVFQGLASPWYCHLMLPLFFSSQPFCWVCSGTHCGYYLYFFNDQNFSMFAILISSLVKCAFAHFLFDFLSWSEAKKKLQKEEIQKVFLFFPL